MTPQINPEEGTVIPGAYFVHTLYVHPGPEWLRHAKKGEWLTSHAEPLAGHGGFHLLRHGVVGSTFVGPLILLAGVDNLQVPGWHDKVIVCRERRGDGHKVCVLEETLCPVEKVDKWEGKKTAGER